MACEFEPSAGSIRKWVALADQQEGRRAEKGGAQGLATDVLTTTERDELARLRRENRQLRVERDILSRAAAWLARETRAVLSLSASLTSLRGIASGGLGVHERNQATVPVATMARVLGVSEAGYYAWRNRSASAHALADTALLRRVRTIHAGSREA